MKINKLFALLVGCYALTACIQDEALNTEADIESCIVEADIESCIVEGDILIARPIIENNRVTLLIKPQKDPDLLSEILSNIKLNFSLTPGATIDPPNGTIRDFTSPQVYTVTSEDKKWEKKYTITCSISEMQTEYDFEHFEVIVGGSKSYHEFYEIVGGNGGIQNIWASGNSGFHLTSPFGAGPEAYPTYADPAGKEGYCVRLTTCSTGFLGSYAKKPIAAGNLFIGTMGSISLSGDPLEATHFGRPFNLVPFYLTGYYKYKAGDVFTDKDKKKILDRTDTFDIYAIMFETDDKTEWLDGSNSLTSPNLISIARIAPEDRKETDEWTYFNLPFKNLPGKTIDPEKLANNKYNLSVVFSSSIDGAYFEGAVGSTLLIDKVKVHLEEHLEEK
ncbi:PCMD domain-containing protein [Bacteroides sp. 224]|uniref:PCMD domain-containing protein n=1 Tax=Bacteroides sp. 224 TaxID=2302936 RepID=UPI0013D8B3C1|nr:PCMD domain-containing protein [Bacteroides sp. 224]NDV65080.1 hypothetical protein [Bacteroides sp. 224]